MKVGTSMWIARVAAFGLVLASVPSSSRAREREGAVSSGEVARVSLARPGAASRTCPSAKPLAPGERLAMRPGAARLARAFPVESPRRLSFLPRGPEPVVPPRPRVALSELPTAEALRIPNKFGVCAFPCGPEGSVSRAWLAPLVSTPGIERPSEEARRALGDEEGPFPNADDPQPFSAARYIVGALPIAAVYSAIGLWAYYAWYYNMPKNPHVIVHHGRKEWFGGHTYAGGADKTGHFFANYAFARVGAQSMIDRGWAPLPAVVANVALTLTFFTLIEVKDGLHVGYGFSVEDQVANILGAGVAALLMLVPTLDKLFAVRMHYWPSREFLDALFGKSDVDMAEDYTGETVMLVFRFGGITALRKSPILRYLRYLDLLVGYNARGFLPKPATPVNREQELFFGVSLNLLEVLRDAYPNRERFPWPLQSVADLSEYLQITPIDRTLSGVWMTPQPKRRMTVVTPPAPTALPSTGR